MARPKPGRSSLICPDADAGYRWRWATDQWGYYCFGGGSIACCGSGTLSVGYGRRLLNEDLTGVAFDSEEGVAALQFFVDLIREHEGVPGGASSGEQAFGSGQLSMHLKRPVDDLASSIRCRS